MGEIQKTVNLDARAILLGDPYLGILLNHLLLIVKRYIYSCKYTKHNLNFIETINILKYHRNIGKFILSEKRRHVQKQMGKFDIIMINLYIFFQL